MVPNARIAGYYAVGALLALSIAMRGWPWAGPLLWPAATLAIVAAAYLGLGPAVYAKRDGRVPLGRRIFFAPTLAGQSISLWHYARTTTPWDPVLPGVIVGRRLRGSQADALVAKGVTAVLDLTAEFSEAPVLRRLAYRNIPLLDLTAPTPARLEEAVTFIAQQRSRGRTVYVHCKVGYSRTAAVVGAYLIRAGHCATVEEALQRLRFARPGIVVRPEALRALRAACPSPPGPPRASV